MWSRIPTCRLELASLAMLLKKLHWNILNKQKHEVAFLYFDHQLVHFVCSRSRDLGKRWRLSCLECDLCKSSTTQSWTEYAFKTFIYLLFWQHQEVWKEEVQKSTEEFLLFFFPGLVSSGSCQLSSLWLRDDGYWLISCAAQTSLGWLHSTTLQARSNCAWQKWNSSHMVV